MRPRIRIPLSAAEQAVLSTWRKRVLAVYALLAAAFTGYLVLTPGTKTIAQDASKDEQARAETCVQQRGPLAHASDRKVPGQVATQDTNAGPRDCHDPVHVGRASARQPQTN